MCRTHRSRLNSESGLIGVGTVIALGVAGVLLYSVAAAVEADSAYYGSVPVPATDVPVELPGSETDVFYAESVETSPNAPLAPPSDLSYLVAGAGQTVRVDARGGKPEGTDSGSARVIGAAFPAEDGTYLVTTKSAELAGRPAPAITFGQSPVGAVRARFDDVVEELKGPTGIVVLAVLGVLFLAPRVGRALDR